MGGGEFALCVCVAVHACVCACVFTVFRETSLRKWHLGIDLKEVRE